jgi:hypothetical protein
MRRHSDDILQVIMLLWFGGLEAKPDKKDGRIFDAEVPEALL